MRGSSSQSQTAHNRPNQQKQLYGHHRPRNAQATKPKEDNMRAYKPRKTKISEAQHQSLMHLIKSKDLTTEQKRALVAERNPFLYLLVLGSENASNKTVPKTRQA
jgi:hypothetical protein